MNLNKIRLSLLSLLLIISVIMSGCGVGVITSEKGETSASNTVTTTAAVTTAAQTASEAVSTTEAATTAKTTSPTTTAAGTSTPTTTTTTTKKRTTTTTTTKKSTSTSKAQSSEKQTSTTKKPTEPKGGKCTLTIQCKSLLDNMDMLAEGHEKYVPDSGVILSKAQYTFKDGDTVYTALKALCDKNGIRLNVRSTMYGKYIAGINNLDEFDAGGESGWKYKVNGKVAPVSCSSYKLSDGDKIEFYYTLKVKD